MWSKSFRPVRRISDTDVPSGHRQCRSDDVCSPENDERAQDAAGALTQKCDHHAAQELADRIGLSPSPCLRRVRRLEAEGAEG